MEFKLITLGVSSASPTVNRFPSAHVLKVRGRSFLIDCGEGAQLLMKRYGINFNGISDIFLSHLHGDHLYGIFGLLSTMSLMGRTTPLNIFAPRGFSRIMEFLNSEIGKEKQYEINFVPVECDSPLLMEEFSNLTVEAFPLRHRVETYGYIFREKQPDRNVHKSLIEPYRLTLREIASLKRGERVIRSEEGGRPLTGSVMEAGNKAVIEQGTEADGSGKDAVYADVLTPEIFTYRPFEPRSFAYCSDTAPFDKLPLWIKGVNLLYHEATFTSEMDGKAEKTFHSTAAEAAECARDAGAGKLVLGHFSSRYRDLSPILHEARDIFPESYLAKEGAEFDIPVNKVADPR